ncbi:chaperone NapD [Plesiomonas sp.]|uniref:chaperone NapD n=1 Tax=Plesiomonas sp. TaxID=2486279 RepID=UPI003F36BE7A
MPSADTAVTTPNDTPDEWHVCGLVVHARPEKIDAVRSALSEIPDTEIPGINEEGKMVVVMQAAASDVLLANIESARNIQGVLAVSLVYHQQDDQGEEMP